MLVRHFFIPKCLSDRRYRRLLICYLEVVKDRVICRNFLSQKLFLAYVRRENDPVINRNRNLCSDECVLSSRLLTIDMARFARLRSQNGRSSGLARLQRAMGVLRIAEAKRLTNLDFDVAACYDVEQLICCP